MPTAAIATTAALALAGDEREVTLLVFSSLWYVAILVTIAAFAALFFASNRPRRR